MRNYLILLTFFVSSLVFAGCDDSSTTGQALVAYTMYGTGTGTTDFVSGDGWDIHLDEARLAFGPVEFCAHVPTFEIKDSMTGCGVVMGQLSVAGVIDALDVQEQELGTVQGIEGQIHSVSYDMGVSWPSTQASPKTVTDALDGFSVRVSGTATKDGSEVPFVFEVTVTPPNQGLFAVRGIPADGSVTQETSSVVVSTDPVQWLRYVDWQKVKDMYDGTTPVTCSEGSTLYNSVYYGITVGRPVNFEWR